MPREKTPRKENVAFGRIPEDVQSKMNEALILEFKKEMIVRKHQIISLVKKTSILS